MEKKLQKLYPSGYNLSAQHLWETHQIFPITFQKEFIKLSVQTLKIQYNKCCLEYTDFKDGLIEFKCLICKKKIDESLKKQLVNAYNFPSQNISKVILLLQKGFYPFEYIDCEKVNETPLPEK